MPLRSFTIACRRIVRSNRLLQIGLVLAFWVLGDKVSRWSGLPIPGGIVGLALVLILFASGAVRHTSLLRGANWFLAEMLLFFVPAVLAILDHREFLGLLGLKVLAVIACSTALVMGVTALVIELCLRVQSSSGFEGPNFGGHGHGLD